MSKPQMVCPVPGCRDDESGSAHRARLYDIAKHIAMARDPAHSTWRAKHRIPDCPLPNEQKRKNEVKDILVLVGFALRTEQRQKSKK